VRQNYVPDGAGAGPPKRPPGAGAPKGLDDGALDPKPPEDCPNPVLLPKAGAGLGLPKPVEVPKADGAEDCPKALVDGAAPKLVVLEELPKPPLVPKAGAGEGFPKPPPPPPKVEGADGCPKPPPKPPGAGAGLPKPPPPPKALGAGACPKAGAGLPNGDDCCGCPNIVVPGSSAVVVVSFY